MHSKTEPGINRAVIKESTAHDLLKRPEIHYQDLVELADIEGHEIHRSRHKLKF